MTGATGQIYFEDRVQQYRSIWREVARELDAEFEELADDIWQIRLHRSSVRLYQYQLPLDDPVVLALAGRKPLVHSLLARRGLPVPEHECFELSALDVPRRMLKRHASGIVIKPASGYGGKGVTTHITSSKQIERAALRASLNDRTLLVEQQILGECYRLLVYRGNVVSAVRRTGIRVLGDGRSTVGALLTHCAELAGLRFPETDADVIFTLQVQDMRIDNVPADGETVLVRSKPLSHRGAKTTDLRTVYDTELIEQVHESVKHDAISAADAIGSEFLGVDVITPDIGTNLRDCDGVINEVNTTPALHHHYQASREPFPRAALDIVSDLLNGRQE